MPTIITTSFELEELEEIKPRIASRLMDSMVVQWVPNSAPNYHDQRRDQGSSQARQRPGQGRSPGPARGRH